MHDEDAPRGNSSNTIFAHIEYHGLVLFELKYMEIEYKGIHGEINSPKIIKEVRARVNDLRLRCR